MLDNTARSCLSACLTVHRRWHARDLQIVDWEALWKPATLQCPFSGVRCGPGLTQARSHDPARTLHCMLCEIFESRRCMHAFKYATTSCLMSPCT